MSGEEGMLDFLRKEKIVEALNEVTPEMARHGCTREMIYNYDLVAFFLLYIPDDYKLAKLVIDTLIEKGYTQRPYACCKEFRMVNLQSKCYFHLFMEATGLYKREDAFVSAFKLSLPRNQLDPFFDHKTTIIPERDEIFSIYCRYLTSREKARIASIALIGAATFGAKDAMRVISRIVWSTRMSERWDE